MDDAKRIARIAEIKASLRMQQDKARLGGVPYGQRARVIKLNAELDRLTRRPH